MKKLALLLTACLILAPLAAKDGDKKKGKKPKKETIEVCFVLDTTGSMGGLIEGAKQKIWAIANEILASEPTPNLRIGLIGYRDRKEAYATQVHDLSDDIDDIYAKLMKFQAQGGGDTPESVNQALHEAVTKIKWNKSKKVLKLVFLVGDVPRTWTTRTTQVSRNLQTGGQKQYHPQHRAMRKHGLHHSDLEGNRQARRR